MADYTSGGDKLHMCYTFDFLGAELQRRAFPRARSSAFEAIVGDGWPCWAFSNHDVVAPCHAAGRTRRRSTATACAKLAAGILLSLRGSVCLYQGEELGLDRGRARASRISPIPTASASGPSSRAATAAARRWSGNRTRRTAASPPASPGCRSPASTCRTAVNRAGRRRRLGARALPRASRLPPRPSGAASPAPSRLLDAPRRRARLHAPRAATSGSSACSISARSRGALRAAGRVQGDCRSSGHGFGGELEADGRTVRLAAGDAFFGPSPERREGEEAMAGSSAHAGEEVLRRGRRHQGRRSRHQVGRVHRLRRPVGLRQVDAAAPHRRARGHHLGHARDRRRGGQRPAAVQARHRHGLPVLRALSAHDGLRQHGLRHEARRRRQGRDRQARARGGRHAADHALSRPPAQAALRRPAPARRHRPRHRARPAASSCSTSRCPISTRRCASRPASRSPSCTSACPTRP